MWLLLGMLPALEYCEMKDLTLCWLEFYNVTLKFSK